MNTTAFVLSSSNGPILFSEFWPIYLISFLWDKTQTALRHVSYVKLISDRIMKEEKLANIRHLKYKSKFQWKEKKREGRRQWQLS